MDGVPDEDQRHDGHRDRIRGNLVLAQERSDRPAQRHRRAGRAADPGSGHEHHPAGDDRPGDLAQDRGVDGDHGDDRRPQRGVVGQRVGQLRLEDPTAKNDENAGDDAGEADGHQRPAPSAAGQADGQRVENRDEDRQPQGETLDRLTDVLHERQAIGLKDGQVGDVGRRCELRSDGRPSWVATLSTIEPRSRVTAPWAT